MYCCKCKVDNICHDGNDLTYGVSQNYWVSSEVLPDQVNPRSSGIPKKSCHDQYAKVKW